MFPEPEKDAVIQIANMVINQGDKDPFIRNIFTLKSCAPVVGSDVRSYEDEGKLLRVSSAAVFSAVDVLWMYSVGCCGLPSTDVYWLSN